MLHTILQDAPFCTIRVGQVHQVLLTHSDSGARFIEVRLMADKSNNKLH